MKEITYQDLYFLIIVNKLKNEDYITVQELEDISLEIKKDYRVIMDFVCSNSIEELLEDHKDILKFEEEKISLKKIDHIEELEKDPKRIIEEGLEEYVRLANKYNKSDKLKIINNKYLRHIQDDIRDDFHNKMNEHNKKLIKSRVNII